MPIYEYGCYDCRKRVSIFWRTFSAAEIGTPICPRCEGDKLKRLVSNVSMIRSEESRLEALSDPSNLSGLDEDDPKALAKFMRQMGKESGEDLGSEFNEVVDRLEAGQTPNEIEQDLPDLGTGNGVNTPNDDWFG